LYSIETYKTKGGKDEIADYIKQLGEQAQTSKEHRIRLKKIVEYLDLLVTYGTRAGLPAIKHIDGDIYELRPLDDRIFYAYWKDDTYILLHHFHKKTQKTPQKEIDQAKRNLKDWLERGGDNGKL